MGDVRETGAKEVMDDPGNGMPHSTPQTDNWTTARTETSTTQAEPNRHRTQPQTGRNQEKAGVYPKPTLKPVNTHEPEKSRFRAETVVDPKQTETETEPKNRTEEGAKQEQEYKTG